jgi:hypothetical protein
MEVSKEKVQAFDYNCVNIVKLKIGIKYKLHKCRAVEQKNNRAQEPFKHLFLV